MEFPSRNPCGVNLSGENISAVNRVVGLSVLFVQRRYTFCKFVQGLIWMLAKMGTMKMESYCSAVSTCNTISETIQEGTNV